MTEEVLKYADLDISIKMVVDDKSKNLSYATYATAWLHVALMQKYRSPLMGRNGYHNY